MCQENLTHATPWMNFKDIMLSEISQPQKDKYCMITLLWGPLEQLRASLVVRLVKNPPEMWETWVQSLGWEDPLEEGMATQSNILAWKIPVDRGAWQATVHGVSESDMTEWLSTGQLKLERQKIVVAKGWGREKWEAIV